MVVLDSSPHAVLVDIRNDLMGKELGGEPNGFFTRNTLVTLTWSHLSFHST